MAYIDIYQLVTTVIVQEVRQEMNIRSIFD